MHQPLWKKLTIGFIKWGLSLALVGWLIFKACQDKSFDLIWQGEKNWGLLAVAFALCFAAVAVTIWRWHLLVVALEIPFTRKDALRLGFLGYMLNFVSLGIVGGDMLKAFFVAREQPKFRAQAVATVIIDRIIGLYALFVMASALILATGKYGASPPQGAGDAASQIQYLCRATLVCTLIGTVFMAMLLGPGTKNARFTGWITHLPKIGPHATQLLWALRLYRHKWGTMIASLLMSFAVHALFAGSGFAIAQALLHSQAANFPFAWPPSLADHLVYVPICNLTGILPLPGNGMGAFEGSLQVIYGQIATQLYPQISPEIVKQASGQGLIVAVAYRIITVLIALVGVVIYLTSRRELDQAMHDAEEIEQPPADPDALLTQQA